MNDTSPIRPIFQPLPDSQMREADRSSLNKMPDYSDWEPVGPLDLALRSLTQPVVIHRKAWEYAMCMLGLEQLGVVTQDAAAIAIGAGTEPPLYHFSRLIRRMVATDLYEFPDNEGTPLMLDDPSQFAPYPYPKERLEVYRMSGDMLDFPADTFDFAFCLSSIEHFGTRDVQRATLEEMRRVTKPGGILCIITELILTDHTHAEYFTWEEINEIFLAHPGLELVGGAPDLRISQSLTDYPVDLARSQHVSRSPHITLQRDGMIWTSFSMFLRNVPNKQPPARKFWNLWGR